MLFPNSGGDSAGSINRDGGHTYHYSPPNIRSIAACRAAYEVVALLKLISSQQGRSFIEERELGYVCGWFLLILWRSRHVNGTNGQSFLTVMAT